MDPLTLFALANGAVSAVKAGCKLYKDIKGAAGDVKDVIKDLEYVKRYYQYNNEKAQQALRILTSEQLNFIKSKFETGGTK